jgi:rubrerythrin
MSKTEENLWQAFGCESQANRKFLAFAEQAEKEGYPHVAKLFRAAAASETLHAHAHFRALEGVKSTYENLQAVITDEVHEFTVMYPAMIEEAQKEGNKAAEQSFVYANKIEKIHASLYQKALDTLDHPPQEVDYYICSSCGNTCENDPPEPCPVCEGKSSGFFKVE